MAVALEAIASAIAQDNLAERAPDADPNRDDRLDDETLAMVEILEGQGIEIGADIYERLGLDPPDNRKSIDETSLEAPQPQPGQPFADDPLVPEPPKPIEPDELAEPPEPPPISQKPAF